MKKSEFKNLIKECLLELIQDGAITVKITVGHAHLQEKSLPKKEVVTRKEPEQRQVSREEVRSILWQHIMGDTAQNTLPQQEYAETNPSAAVAPVTGEVDIKQLGSENTWSKWAKLAFSKK